MRFTGLFRCVTSVRKADFESFEEVEAIARSWAGTARRGGSTGLVSLFVCLFSFVLMCARSLQNRVQDKGERGKERTNERERERKINNNQSSADAGKHEKEEVRLLRRPNVHERAQNSTHTHTYG